MVFLRPALLAQALDIEARARRFYADPSANADLLRRWSIDYVLARPDQAKRLMRPARAEPARAGRAGLGVRGGRGRVRRASPRRRARVPLHERAPAMTGRRYTRAGLLALAGAAAAGVTARQLLGGGGTTVSPPPGPAPSRFRIRSAFRGPDGWGPRWVPLQGPLMVAAGPAVLTVPAGVHTTAPDQPMPVQLLDAVHADGAQRLEFGVTDASLRPGLLLRSTGPHAFAGVTIEGGRLVIAEYAFDGRRVVARGDTDPVAAGSAPRAGRPLSGRPRLGEGLAGRRRGAGLAGLGAGGGRGREPRRPRRAPAQPAAVPAAGAQPHRRHRRAAAADRPGCAGADLGHPQPAPERRPRRAHARVERLPGAHQVRMVGGRRRVRPQPRTGRRRLPADGAPPDPGGRRRPLAGAPAVADRCRGDGHPAARRPADRALRRPDVARRQLLQADRPGAQPGLPAAAGGGHQDAGGDGLRGRLRLRRQLQRRQLQPLAGVLRRPLPAVPGRPRVRRPAAARPGRVHHGRPRVRPRQQRRPNDAAAVDVAALEPDLGRLRAARLLRRPRRRRALPDAGRPPLLRSGREPEPARQDQAGDRAADLDGADPAHQRRRDVRRLQRRHLRHAASIPATAAFSTTTTSTAGRTSTGAC